MTAAGASALVLLTGCSRTNTDYPVCPKDSREVANRLGGTPEEWRILRGSELWEYRGTPRSFTGQGVGKILIDVSDGVPKELRPGQEATTERALFKCGKYEELNPPPKILPEK